MRSSKRKRNTVESKVPVKSNEFMYLNMGVQDIKKCVVWFATHQLTRDKKCLTLSLRKLTQFYEDEMITFPGQPGPVQMEYTQPESDDSSACDRDLNAVHITHMSWKMLNTWCVWWNPPTLLELLCWVLADMQKRPDRTIPAHSFVDRYPVVGLRMISNVYMSKTSRAEVCFAVCMWMLNRLNSRLHGEGWTVEDLGQQILAIRSS